MAAPAGQNRARTFAVLAVAASASAIAIVACSTHRARFDEGPPPLSDPDAAPPDGASCGFKCSPDLKRVLRGCEGAEEVVATCGPDQGCAVDTCVDACTSAALSKGSIGCSFWTLPPDDERYGPGACFAVLVANTWDRAVSLSAEFAGAPLDISRSVYTATRTGPGSETYTLVNGPLEPGQVGIVFLSQSAVPIHDDASRCPAGVVPAVDVDPITHGTTKTVAFHIEADAPISAYSIFPYGGAASFYPASTLLLPVSTWDKSYIAVTTGKFGDPNDASPRSRRTLQIVAHEDDTQVWMRPTVDIVAGLDVERALKGEAKSWTLSRGQALQINQRDTPAGSPIVANKPVGVFGGSACTFLPIEHGACDLTHQQIAPFAQWGSAYPLVPFRPRIETASGGDGREVVAWSFVGAVDGTVLTYDPSKPPGAPEALSAGQVVNFMTDALVSVRSQDPKHPFYAGVHMTGALFGGGVPGAGNRMGDPEFVNVVPAEQFLDRYVFFADYTYPDTSLTIVRRRTSNGFAPVELECAGEISTFTPLGTAGEYEWAWVKLTAGFTPQKFPRGECGYGRHEAHSTGPFSVTVWGVGEAASYGYAGGMGARPVNDAPRPTVQ
jgi:IgGFc binding protein